MDRPLKRIWWRRPLGLVAAIVAAIAVMAMAATQVDWSDDRVIRLAGDEVVLDRVRRGAFQPVLHATGLVKPRTSVALQNSISGRVDAVHVKPGDRVGAGKLLFELSNPETEMSFFNLEVQVAEQLNALTQREQSLERGRQEDELEVLRLTKEIGEIKIELERRRQLLMRGHDKPSEVKGLMRQETYLDTVLEKRLGMLKSRIGWQTDQILQAKTLSGNLMRNLETARDSLDALNIRATMDGTLSDFSVKRGEVVERGSNLVTLFELGTPIIEAEVDEIYLDRLSVGDEASWRDAKGAWRALRVRRILPEVIDGKITLEMDFVEAPPEGLVHGQRLDIQIRTRALADDVLIVANGGFLAQTGGNWIFALDEATGRARKVPVEILATTRDEVALKTGPQPGSVVVVSSYLGFVEAEYLKIE
jgi:HlyD family secretion protein